MLLRHLRASRPAIPTSAKFSYWPSAATPSNRGFRIGGNQSHDLHAALEDFFKSRCDFRNRDGLVLDIDRAVGGIDRLDVLRKNRPFPAGNVVSPALRTCVGVAIAAPMHRALDLHDTLAARNRRARRKAQAVIPVVAPCAVVSRAFACFVPALDEIVMHVGCRRPRDLDVGVMTFALSRVTGRSHGPGGQIHASDERRLASLAGVDQPALLMLTVRPKRAVPADAEP